MGEWTSEEAAITTEVKFSGEQEKAKATDFDKLAGHQPLVSGQDGRQMERGWFEYQQRLVMVSSCTVVLLAASAMIAE